MKRITNLCVLALLTTASAAGCSEAEQSPATAPTPSASTPAKSPEPELITLKEACPEIEAALPAGDRPTKIIAFGDRLVELHEAGDREAKNAINFLAAATLDLLTVLEDKDASLLDLLDARAGFRDAIDVVADRCRTVGSSALQ